MFTNAAGDGETMMNKLTKIIHNNRLTTVNNDGSQKKNEDIKNGLLRQ